MLTFATAYCLSVTSIILAKLMQNKGYNLLPTDTVNVTQKLTLPKKYLEYSPISVVFPIIREIKPEYFWICFYITFSCSTGI